MPSCQVRIFAWILKLLIYMPLTQTKSYVLSHTSLNQPITTQVISLRQPFTTRFFVLPSYSRTRFNVPVNTAVPNLCRDDEEISNIQIQCPSKSETMATVRIKYCNIPAYLRSGDFYRNLDSDDLDSIIEIPADRFHPDGMAAGNLEQFRQLLRVMVFWVLDDIPTGVLDFCRKHDVRVWEKGMADLPGPVATEILPLLLTAYSSLLGVTLADVMKTGRWDAALHGDLRLLKHLHEERFAWHKDTCWTASGYGHLECLRYAHENGCPWEDKVYKYAALHGHVRCMQYACGQGLQWHVDVCAYAAAAGHVNCLQFAREHGCPWDRRTTVFAAAIGHLECLQFAHENGCSWDCEVVTAAAKNGHANCLLYALEHTCPVDKNACKLICINGHLDCLRLLHLFGIPWDKHASFQAARCLEATCLQYLNENGCPWDKVTSLRAALAGHIEPLRYSIEHGCPYYDDVVARAVPSTNLECLRYLVEEQLMCLDENVFTAVLLRGDLVCLEYLLDQGCPYLEAGFPGDMNMYDTVFHDNPEFILCVQCAVGRGWVPCKDFTSYIVHKDDACR